MTDDERRTLLTAQTKVRRLEDTLARVLEAVQVYRGRDLIGYVEMIVRRGTRE